jgi:hypothetical protein
LGLASIQEAAPYFLHDNFNDNPWYHRFRLVMYGIARAYAYLTLPMKLLSPVAYADDQMFTQIMTEKWPWRWSLDECPPFVSNTSHSNPTYAAKRLAGIECQQGDMIHDGMMMDQLAVFPGRYMYGTMTLFRPSHNGITKYSVVSITIRVNHPLLYHFPTLTLELDADAK